MANRLLTTPKRVEMHINLIKGFLQTLEKDRATF